MPKANYVIFPLWGMTVIRFIIQQKECSLILSEAIENNDSQLAQEIYHFKVLASILITTY